MVKTVSYSNGEIIKNIMRLYLGGNPIEVDQTYSKGSFYKEVEKPLLKFDIVPQATDVVQADCRNLPLKDGSVGSIMFDPPFLATTGKSLTSNDNNNIINKRYGTYPAESELYELYRESISEFNRILKPDGILIFKCQDKVSSGKQYMSHCDIYNMALKEGFMVEDLFVLVAKSRLVAQWQIKNQKHSRKFHSYFFVFRKPKQQQK